MPGVDPLQPTMVQRHGEWTEGLMTWKSYRAGAAAVLFSALLLLRIADAAAGRQAPSDASLPDVQKLGPRIGERIPDFSLTDQHGQTRTLASLMGKNGLMLVFFRSADW
jgi:cytochrome oxidase Cu insertion factor (SCO1/SenC/PrrC family)